MKKTGFITKVNKGLRVWLFKAGTQVQQTDFTDRAEGRNAVLELQQLLKALGRKSLMEEQHFLPAIALHAPFVLSQVEEDNKQVKNLYARLSRCMQNYLQPGTYEHYQLTGLSIQQMYMEFLSFMLIYMNRQESLFNGPVSLDDATSFMEEMAWLDAESADESYKKKTFLGGAGPERLQAEGVGSDYRSKGVLFAA